eukprot:366429-Chlamydomonas_euryale.AAC.8
MAVPPACGARHEQWADRGLARGCEREQNLRREVISMACGVVGYDSGWCRRGGVDWERQHLPITVFGSEP